MVRKLSQDQASNLEVIPSANEIKKAVWHCNPNKAPGPDGFNLNFIRKMWSLVGAEFQQMVVKFFLSGNLLWSSNVT